LGALDCESPEAYSPALLAVKLNHRSSWFLGVGALAFRPALTLLALSGPPFFVALRGTGRLAPRSLTLQPPARGDLRAKVPRYRLRGFLPAEAAWSCPGSARSRASAQAPRQARPAQVSLSSLRKPADQIHQGLIRFPVLRRKARDDVAEIVFYALTPTHSHAPFSIPQATALQEVQKTHSAQRIQRRTQPKSAQSPLRFSSSPPLVAAVPAVGEAILS
jgi:hypothetical protein